MLNATMNRQAVSPILPGDVFIGWFEKFRNWVEPSTDAALEGIFAAGSVALAQCVGREVAVHYGRPLHSNLYISLIGPTGVPRKSTVLSRGQTVIEKAFTNDFVRVVKSIGSGEGLLEAFCNEVQDPVTKKMVLKPIPNQRVLLDEPEFCALLKKAKRVGSNISEVLLSLYDGEDLSPRTRTRSIRVERPFFNIVTATTPESLESNLADTDIESGLIPRFANFYCSPREPMAYPPPPDNTVLDELTRDLQDIAAHARDLGKQNPIIELTPQAKNEWAVSFGDIYQTMGDEQPMVAAIMARVPTMIIKWSLLYALQAGNSEITHGNLARATLVGTYLMETARLVPQTIQKSVVAKIESKIIKTLCLFPSQYLTANDIHRHVSGRIKAAELRNSLQALVSLGVIEEGKMPGGAPAYKARED